jgi:hypothetical protein
MMTLVGWVVFRWGRATIAIRRRLRRPGWNLSGKLQLDWIEPARARKGPSEDFENTGNFRELSGSNVCLYSI